MIYTICDNCITPFHCEENEIEKGREYYYAVCPMCGHENEIYDYEDYGLEILEEDYDEAEDMAETETGPSLETILEYEDDYEGGTEE